MGTAAERLAHGSFANENSISSNVCATAVILEDGSVECTGNPRTGGDSSCVSGRLASDVLSLHSTQGAFAALKKDGSVVTWGSQLGGDSSDVASQLSAGIV